MRLTGIGKNKNNRSWREVKYARFQRRPILETDFGSNIPDILMNKVIDEKNITKNALQEKNDNEKNKEQEFNKKRELNRNNIKEEKLKNLENNLSNVCSIYG